jgi:protein involved in polysaccharide export with SLBB domain
MKTLIKYSIIFFSLYMSRLPLGAQTTNSGLSSYDQTQIFQSQKISVVVTGAVKNPGTYILNATDRADRAIQLANQYDLLFKQGDKTDKSNQIDKADHQIDKFNPDDIYISDIKEKPRRNISLHRRTGEIIKVDIQKYFATKDEHWDPFLSNGDIIFVPRFEDKKDLFAVYGGVNVPGQIEYSEGDRVTDAIQLAYGFTSRAMVDSIALYRYDGDSQPLKEQVISWTQIQAVESENVKLQPGDRIIIPEREDLREDYHVTISGEVRFPGVYPITREQTKLSSIIQKAGGLTQYASLKSSLLYRSETAPKELHIEEIIGMRGITSLDDTSNFRLENELRLRRGIVNVSFEKLLIDHDTTQDVMLHTGDYIDIPPRVITVYVYGQVVVPGRVPFVQGEKVEYYIKKAGGYTEHAHSSDVMVIKRGSRQWLLPSETEVEEGDYIWIPKNLDKPSTYYLNIIGQTASIISVAVSIVLLTIQLKK